MFKIYLLDNQSIKEQMIKSFKKAISFIQSNLKILLLYFQSNFFLGKIFTKLNK